MEEKRMIEAHSQLAPRRLRGKPVFTHRCENGCGRVVSWNKKCCLACVIELARRGPEQEILTALENKGDIV